MSISKTKSPLSIAAADNVYPQLRKDALELSQLSTLKKMKTADDFSASTNSLQRITKNLNVIAGWQNTSTLIGSVTSLSILNNRELNQSIENLEWNLGMLSSKMTGTVGNYLYQSVAKQFKSDKEWTNLKAYVEYDAKKVCAIINAAALTLEVQSYVGSGDLQKAKDKLPELNAALDESSKYLPDEIQKGLIVMGAQLSSAVKKGDLAGAKKKAKELEMVSVVGVTPKNAPDAANYASGSQNAAFLGYTFNPENRSFWSDVVVSSGPLVGSVQMLGDAGYYAYQGVFGDSEKQGTNFLLAGVNFGFAALSIYSDYKSLKAVQNGQTSPYSISGIMSRIAGKTVAKIAEEGTARAIFKDGAVLLTKDQLKSVAKQEAVKISEEQLDAIVKGSVKLSGEGSTNFTKKEVAQMFEKNVYAAIDDVTKDGYVHIGKFVEKLADDGLVKLGKNDIFFLAEAGGIKVMKTTGKALKDANPLSEQTLTLTSKMVDELEEYGLIRLTTEEAKDISKFATVKINDVFRKALDKLDDIKSLQKETRTSLLEKADNVMGKIESKMSKGPKFIKDRVTIKTTKAAFTEGGKASIPDVVLNKLPGTLELTAGEFGLGVATGVVFGTAAGIIEVAKDMGKMSLRTNVVRPMSKITLQGYGKNTLERDWIISKTNEQETKTTTAKTGETNTPTAKTEETKTVELKPLDYQIDFMDKLGAFTAKEQVALSMVNGSGNGKALIEKINSLAQAKGSQDAAKTYVLSQLADLVDASTPKEKIATAIDLIQ